MPLEKQNQHPQLVNHRSPHSVAPSEGDYSEEADTRSLLNQTTQRGAKSLRPHEVLQLQRSIGNQKVMRMLAVQPKPAVVQRVLDGVGLEMEIGADWSVTTGTASPAATTEPQPVAEGTPIISQPLVQLTAEDASGAGAQLEIVTAPQASEDQAAAQAATQDLLARLNARAGGDPFPASELPGGSGTYMIQPGKKPIQSKSKKAALSAGPESEMKS